MVSTTASNLHTARVREPHLARVLLGSLLVHMAVIVGLSISLSSTIRTAPPAAIQVKLVGVPQPKVAVKPPEKIEEIRTQDSAAPKEPPKEMKNVPESKAASKFLDKLLETISSSVPQPIEAAKRPPVLDKNPEKKKVVKNKPDAKVVKNPEDFLNSLDFVDQLETAQNSTQKATTPATDKPAGDGPEIQLNLADEGVVDGIRRKVMDNWVFTPGIDTSALIVTVWVEVDDSGNVLEANVQNSSGNAAFDASLLRAVRKASPLPVPLSDIEKFRQMSLRFNGQ